MLFGSEEAFGTAELAEFEIGVGGIRGVEVDAKIYRGGMIGTSDGMGRSRGGGGDA